MAAMGIGLNEAALMDPQQRLLLTAAVEASASITHSKDIITADGTAPVNSFGGGFGAGGIAGIPRSEWGVYVGISALDYSRVAARCERVV